MKSDSMAPKKDAILRAAVKLMDQGYMMENIKVSDIAKEAGVGKGTVYEYFRSKNEIIVQAAFYDMADTAEDIEAILMQGDGFWDSFSNILDWIDRKSEVRNSIGRYMRMQNSLEEIPEEFCGLRDGRSNRMRPGSIYHYARALAKKGVESGELSAAVPLPALTAALLSGVLMYLICLMCSDGEDVISRGEARAFVMNSIRSTCGAGLDKKEKGDYDIAYERKGK